MPGLDGPLRDVIYDHVFANADREVGGVLVGRASNSPVPQIVGAIAALRAAERRASLTFTQDAWELIHAELDQRYPEYDIVGWYHSHPGFGIFLSEPDLFIHRHFFAGPAQVALVVDPLAGSEGLFGWQGEAIVPLYERPTARSGLGKGWRPPRDVYPGGTTSTVGPVPPVARISMARLGVAGVAGLLAGATLWIGGLRGDRPPTRTVTEHAAAQTPAASASKETP